MKKSMYICVLILLLLVLSALLLSCTAHKPQLHQGDWGYNLSELLDQEEDFVIDQFAALGMDPQFHEELGTIDSYQRRVYEITETLYGIEYTTWLQFYIYGDHEEHRLGSYCKSTTLSNWPEGDTADALQNTLNAMIKEYGKPDNNDTEAYYAHLFERVPSSKQVGWITGKRSTRDYIVLYDKSSNQTTVTISDSSVIATNDFFNVTEE